MPPPGRPPGWQSSGRLWELWSEVVRCWVYRDRAPPAPFAGPGSPPPMGGGGSRQLCPQRHLQSSGDSLSTLACARAVGHFISSQLCQQTVPVILKAYSVTLLSSSCPDSGVATAISLDWMLSLETHQANRGIDLGGLGKLRSKKGGYLPRDVYSFSRS